MEPDAIDRNFRRFCVSRDPAALAAVFDATAPRLLLVGSERDQQARVTVVQGRLRVAAGKRSV